MQKQLAGACVFCGGLHLSKQHILPLWINKIIPKESTHSGFKIKIALPNEKNAILHAPEIKTKQGDLGTLKIRNICKTCNNGWMSRIEENAMSDLSKLINGEAISLNTDQQMKISAWIMLTCIDAEFTDIPTQAIPERERTFLMKYLHPSNRWVIYIARYKGKEKKRYKHYGVAVGEEKDRKKIMETGIRPKPNLQSSAIFLGNLFIYAMSSHTDGVMINRSVAIPNLEIIWPSRTEDIDIAGNFIGDELTTAISDSLILSGKR
jgi:hypothetical protein